MKQLALVWAVFFALAIAITFPLVLQLDASLLGDARIDVWNHAWGYWWFEQALGSGELPVHTQLAGGPEGGALWFIDAAGATAALPVTALLGPSVAYNLTLLVRVSLAGLAGWLLARELGAKDSGAWLGGLAYATTPFLLCELANGISEVCATQWVGFTLWAALRATRSWTTKDLALLGFLGGLTAVVSFYQGLAGALTVAGLLLARLPGAWKAGLLGRQAALGLLAAAGLGALVFLPVWALFHGTLEAADALIRRQDGGMMLVAHNAVDPRIYFMPGNFQSVDLAAEYDEPFVHTAYLRWSVLLLAGFALFRRRSLWPVLVATVVSLICGLGNYLWWDGAFVQPGGMMLSLPFAWLLKLLPQLAITHPLRLALPAMALCCALAGLGLSELSTWRPAWSKALWLALPLVAAEGLFGSSASYPIPRSSAQVPAWYEVDQGMVLDLPAEVGTTMLTSRYFWYQTAHGRPIPYTPDVRLGSAREQSLQGLGVEGGQHPGQQRPSEDQLRQGLEQHYGLIVLHEDFAEKAGVLHDYEQRLSQLLGPPERVEGALIWRPQR